VRAALYFVELAVTDWAAAVRWYQDVLRLEVLARDEGEQFALLAASGARLALKGGDAPASGALLAFEVEDLGEWVNWLREKGVKLEGRAKASAEGYRRVKFRGPGGVAVTLFQWGEAGERP
jgi:catechol 2,3-dioxygenase-like lactoylglutathione lyase family enzyme